MGVYFGSIILYVWLENSSDSVLARMVDTVRAKGLWVDEGRGFATVFLHGWLDTVRAKGLWVDEGRGFALAICSTGRDWRRFRARGRANKPMASSV